MKWFCHNSLFYSRLDLRDLGPIDAKDNLDKLRKVEQGQGVLISLVVPVRRCTLSRGAKAEWACATATDPTRVAPILLGLDLHGACGQTPESEDR